MNLSIRLKTVLIVTAIFFCAISAITAVSSYIFAKEYSEVVQTNAFVIGRNLKFQLEQLMKLGIPIEDLVGFEKQCQEVTARNKHIAYTMVVDLNGKILFHSDLSQNDTLVEDLKILKAVRHAQEARWISETDKNRYYVAVTPAFDSYNRQAGAIAIGMPTNIITQKTKNLIVYSVGAAFIFFVLGACLVFFAFSLWVKKPLMKLINVIKDIREKGLLSKKVVIHSKDEIGQLAYFFNEMLEDLKSTTTSVDNLNREISERKKAEGELRKTEEKYRTQFEGALDAIYVADAETGTLIECNPAGTKLVGREKSELIGKSQQILYPLKENAEEFNKTFKRYLEQKQDQTLETQIITKTGQIRDVAIKANLLEIGGKKVLQAIFRDITERKKVEHSLEVLNRDLAKTIGKLTQANRELNNFLHIAAHDLKAPVRAIGTLANWLETDCANKLDKKGKKHVGLLSKRARRLSKHIDAILYYSKIERQKQNEKVVNLNSLTEDIIQSIIPPENFEIIIETELPKIKCEQVLISKVFENLLTNAVKFMDKEKGQVRINCFEEDDFWKFGIADNGPGIDEKYFKKIFQIFQILHRRDEIEGTGVGLSVVKKIVNLYGGKIWVESEVGKGSTFFFSLPKHSEVIKNARN